MAPNFGPSQFPWAALVPELYVSDLTKSLKFWCGCLGFKIAFDRPEERFAYLERGRAQLMLEEHQPDQRSWITGALQQPFGRGVNFQIEVSEVQSSLDALDKAGWPLYLQPEEKWYRTGPCETGVLQFLVQDPDGYLARLSCPIGERLVQPDRAGTP